MDIHQVIREPHITEKANIQKTDTNQVSFKVHKSANKIEIRKAVETLFNVEVLEVRTMNVKGKKRRVGRNIGRKPHWKKAVVKLAEGKNIEFFEGM